LEEGHILICDENNCVIEVNRANQTVRAFGKINSPGYNAQTVAEPGLNSPQNTKPMADHTAPYAAFRRGFR
jgi:hypothetical protein